MTPDGEARLARIETVQAKWADALGAEFTAAELATASAVMARVLARLDQGE